MLGFDFGDLGHLWSQNDVITSWLRLHSYSAASHIHIRHIQSIWAHWYAVHRHSVAVSLSSTKTARHRIYMSWVTCGGIMMSFGHGWDYHPIQTASDIHIRHLQGIWAHWHTIHRHTVAASLSNTHLAWLWFWWSGSLMESKWCHYVMVEASILFNCFTHPYMIHTKYLSTFICSPQAYSNSLTQLYPQY